MRGRTCDDKRTCRPVQRQQDGRSFREARRQRVLRRDGRSGRKSLDTVTLNRRSTAFAFSRLRVRDSDPSPCECSWPTPRRQALHDQIRTRSPRCAVDPCLLPRRARHPARARRGSGRRTPRPCCRTARTRPCRCHRIATMPGALISRNRWARRCWSSPSGGIRCWACSPASRCSCSSCDYSRIRASAKPPRRSPSDACLLSRRSPRAGRT